MQIEFDPEKDRTNLAKHGVSLRLASRFELNTALVVEDDRKEYGEARYLALGRIGRNVHALVFTYRGSVVRVISLRRAEKHEREIYHAGR